MFAVSDEEPSAELNEELYSRQLYVLGAAAQRRLQRSKVLVTGKLSGLGAELCKNVVLAGVSSLSLHDEAPCTRADLSTAAFVMRESDIAKSTSRSQAFLEELRDMNANVAVQRVAGEPDFRSFDVVVVVNESKSKLQKISGLVRSDKSLQTRFIATGSYGLISYCFSDFGSSWEVTDNDGEVTKSGLILAASKAGLHDLEIQTEVPHRLSDGDWVKFTCEELPGPFAINLIRNASGKLSETSFKVSLNNPDVALPSTLHAFDGAYFEQVKMPVVVSTHVPLAQSLENPRIVNNSYEDESKPSRVWAILNGLWDFVEKNGSLPDSSKCEVEKVVEDVCNRWQFAKEHVKEIVGLVQSANGSLSPITSFMGGVAGQEVLKACTGKFLPLDQWLLFAASECLSAVPQSLVPILSRPHILPSRYEGQIRVFGEANQKKLGALRVFVVGAGALGCEILKNLALMGVSTIAEGGMTFVTDPDSIEMSNLNRQFLFRPSTVGKNKAICAVESAKKMNPEFAAQAFQERVSADSAGPFTDKFWDSLDLVINALDNVPSRMFVDSQCVYYAKPLFESGTLGTKANTLPVIPNLTESYGSDPVKDFDATPEIPACTLHAYPNLFEHTLTWARDAVFEKEYALDPSEAKSFLDAFRIGQSAQHVQSMLRQPNSIAGKLRAARGVIVGIMPEDHAEGLFPFSFATHGSIDVLSGLTSGAQGAKAFSVKECVQLARLKFQELFTYKIELLLQQHPPDSKDGDSPFWTGKRRLPQPISFDLEDSSHILFVCAAARLHARIHGLDDRLIDVDYVKKTIKSSPVVPSNLPRTSAKAAKDDVDWQQDVQKMEKVAQGMPALHIDPCKFDKDDEVHVDLVWSAAVIRAKNYRIPTMDRMEAKRVVGRIIPAIATSTAAATGLVALELYKYVLGEKKNISIYRASNFNLAVNSYASFEPSPCTTAYRFDTLECNLWTTITLKGDMTVDDLIDTLSSRFRGFEISSLTTTGEVTLFNDLFSGDDDSVRASRISDLYRRVVGKEPPEVFIPINADGDFEDGRYEDFIVPPIRVRWKDTSS